MKEIEELSVEKVVQINARLCAEYQEPHLLRDETLLRSAIEVGAFYRFPDGRYAHGGVTSIAGVLCYKVAQAQAFLDGNKRTAFIAARAFLALNGFELKYPKGSVQDLILGFAEPAGRPMYNVEDAKDWFQRHAYHQR
jgi:death-on-curing protein